MSNLAISVDGLSKRYRIGVRENRADTLTGAVLAGLRRPLDNLRKLRRLSRFDDDGGESDDSIWALRNVSFDVRQGEVVGVVGRNGAGKSTLLKLLARITEPTRGQARVWGRVGSLLEVGTGFHPELTGRENTYLNGCILGMKKAEIARKFDEIVAFSGVERFIDTTVKHYSSGMYVRLAFAVAAHLEPEILLLDEVLAVGDLEFQKKCLGKVREVAGEGRTVIFVSHNMGVVQRLCTRAVLLHEGSTLSEGPTAAVVEQYVGLGKAEPGEHVWPDPGTAPGNDVLRVRSIRVTGADGNVRTNFDVRDPIHVELNYALSKPGYPIVTRLVFSNQFGMRLFEVLDNLDSPWSFDRPRPPGEYRTVCIIPGDLLNEGRIYVGYGIDTIVPARLPAHAAEWNILSFTVEDRRDENGVRGNYPLPWSHQAAFRPRMKVSVEHRP